MFREEVDVILNKKQQLNFETNKRRDKTRIKVEINVRRPGHQEERRGAGLTDGPLSGQSGRRARCWTSDQISILKL